MVDLIDTIVYAGRLKDKSALMSSSSGGAFTALSDFFLKNDNAVVAAIYNYENHMTEFQMILDEKQRERAKGSKYMQSKPGDIYREAYRWLMENPEKELLFIGMGCQSDGFRKFSEIKGIRDRVYIVDIICHGSPSPKLWREYAESIQKKDGKITYLTFKDKRDGWKAPTAYVKVNGAEKSIKDYVKVFYDDLFCVDIVCHGVPSKKVWNAYLRWQEQKNHSKVAGVNFRNKRDFGWRDHVETLYFENGKSTSSRVFKELFYGHTVLRPSCYECPYKSVMHPGDITIADYWGIEKAAPEFDDNKGISLVLVNNEAGEKAFEKVKEGLIWKQTKLEDSMQPPLKAPFPKPVNREQFWSDFENKSFEYVAKKYGGIGLKNDAKSLFRKIKRKIKKLVSKGGKRNTGTI